MLNAGLDIGNGYVKALIKDPGFDEKAEPIDIPSAAAVVIRTEDSDTNIRITEPGAIANEMKDIYNNMEVSFDTSLVDNGDRHRYIGNRAILYGRNLHEFNIKEFGRSKTETELSFILSLSMLAGKTLSDYYKKNGKLPGKDEILHVDASVALSLPIIEYMARRDEVSKRYKATAHLVRIHNFQHVIRIELHVKEITIAPEGASAQFAIASKGEKFMEALVNNMMNYGVKLPENIGVQHIMSADNILGIDIGEGTVNFPMYQEYKFNTDVSSTFERGYGTVMDQVFVTSSKIGSQFSFKRKKLIRWLELNKDNPLKKQQYDKIMKVVNAEIDAFTDELIDRFQAILENSNGAFIDVIYVYGGGATPVQESLYPKLIKAVAKHIGDDIFMPILYLHSSYSRFLNRDGLYALAASNDDQCMYDLAKLYEN